MTASEQILLGRVMEELWATSWSRVDKTTFSSRRRRVWSLWDL